MLDLVKLVKKVNPDFKVDFETADYPETYPADEPMRRCPDINKAQVKLNYKPNIDLEQGLKRFFNWARENY